MRLIRGFRDGADSVAYGIEWCKERGYRHVLTIDFHRWQWIFEFGRGDGYCWLDGYDR